MDTTGGFDTVQTDVEDATDAAVEEQGFVVGSDERRMHVRAYNHWVSLLDGAPFPAIDRLDPAAIGDFGVVCDEQHIGTILSPFAQQFENDVSVFFV